MGLNLSPGFVLCPPCSGSGCVKGTLTGTCLPCRMCKSEGQTEGPGSGQVPAAQAEAFWDCILAKPSLSQPIRCAGDVSGWEPR